ncbi:MAG TPA: ribosome biogenesis GTP-binding protein YihA/YsxC [Acidobacteriota bacterium]|nr:ribosome biogenesis GTP-binding protein YihA/YsxC [Acidobacteriota bacterium]
MKIQEVRPEFTTSRPGDYPLESLPEIAFLGRSNVGKSSLINSLLNRKRLARTSKAPGRTRAIHWYRVEGGGLRCRFVDLPGYGYARVPRRVREREWAALIETYLHSQRPMAMAIQLLDIRRDGPTTLDEQMIDWLRANNRPTTYVLTKADKLSSSRRARAAQLFARRLQLPEGVRPIPYSAVTGAGRAELWSLLDTHIAAS